MKKIVIWLLVWLLCINLCVGIAVAEAVMIPNVLEGFEENESILDICWGKRHTLHPRQRSNL